jgi:hypothetical protein
MLETARKHGLAHLWGIDKKTETSKSSLIIVMGHWPSGLGLDFHLVTIPHKSPNKHSLGRRVVYWVVEVKIFNAIMNNLLLQSIIYQTNSCEFGALTPSHAFTAIPPATSAQLSFRLWLRWICLRVFDRRYRWVRPFGCPTVCNQLQDAAFCWFQFSLQWEFQY